MKAGRTFKWHFALALLLLSPSLALAAGKAYDFKTALKRAKIIYCGQSPTFEEVEALADASDKKTFLHDSLEECLQSTFWIQQELPRLADTRIRPLKAIGMDGDIVLADYTWDYRLFAYVLSGDRDARMLLTADFHVDENMQPVLGTIKRQLPPQIPTGGGFLGDAAKVLAGLIFGSNPNDSRIILGTGQPLAPDRRAGMITTQWFFVLNTMFAELPRAAAAQAYRAYLGLDMARGEGLTPVAAEPRDVDNKGVKQGECAGCHSAIDPAAYAFSAYNGIDTSIDGIIGNSSGKYNANRTPWEGDGVVLGKPVGDLLEWAKVAADSLAFRQNLARMFFVHGIGRNPIGEAEIQEWKSLADKLPEDGYSANKLIHRLADTLAFGGI